MPGETADKIREKYLLKGSFLVKLQASSLMSKNNKIMHEWSLVINLFRWLTIQTTFKIDSIPCNCVCKFKTFSKQYCLDYYIKRKKCSSFTETYRVFRERQKRLTQHISATIMNGWNRDVRPRRTHLIFWRPCILSFQHVWAERFNFSWHLINICLLHSHLCSSVGIFLLVLAALLQNLSVCNAGKNVLSMVKRIHGVRRNTLMVFYLFVWTSWKWKKKQFYIFNNSSILEMLGKDHVFIKKDFILFFQAQCL